MVILNHVDSITNLRFQIRHLEKEIKSIVSSHKVFELLMILTGCGPITAATIIAETGNIHRFSTADKFVSYVGASPRIDSSGKSVEIIRKISKKGSRYLRHALYMIAEFARRHNPVLKAQFERVRNGNKKRHKLAVIAVANKIARYIYSITKHESCFVIIHQSLMRLL